jgi:phosphate transport system permease protein
MAVGSPAASQVLVRRTLSRGGFDWRSAAFSAFLLFCLVFALAVIAVLIAQVTIRGMPVLTDRGADFLTSNLSTRAGTAGVGQGIFGSLFIALFVIILAIPIGVMTAIYLEEYAPDNRLTRFIAINIRNLAGVPSVVYGLLGLAVFVPVTRVIESVIFPDLDGTGRSIVAASITLSALVLPIVIITASESIRAVPGTIREAGYGAGASRWQVTRSLVLPSAIPGILTGTILSVSRALGETAPLIIIGVSYNFFSTGNRGTLEGLFGPYTALPAIVYGWASNPELDFRELTAAAIVVLLAVTLFANAVAILLRNRYEIKW